MVPMPQKNGDILPWAEQASREINRFSASGVPGMLVRDGVGGVGFEQIPQNLRDRRVSSKVPGRFDYEVFFGSEEGDDVGSRKIKFKNCYFDLAGRTLQAGGFANDFNLPDGEVLFALKVDATGRQGSSKLIAYTGDSPLSQMQSEQEDVEYYITPLYLFTNGALTCDFRTGPYVAMGEAAL
jgi:hypothetical protein